MATAADSAGIEPIISRSAGREALAKALKLYVGYRGARRRFTMLHLIEASGVKCRVIECVMEGADSAEYRKIEIGDLLSLCAVLGRQFTTEWLKLAGLGAFELMEGQEPLPQMLDACASPSDETVPEKRRRLIRELQALEDGE